MAVDASALRTNFPEFASTTDYPGAVVDFWLSVAVLMLNQRRWGRLYDVGVQLFTAHNLVLERQAQAAAAGGGVPGTAVGAISAKAVGPASMSYDVAATTVKDMGNLNMTTYGTRFSYLLDMIGMGPVQIGVGCSPPWVGGAWAGPPPWPLPSGTGFSS